MAWESIGKVTVTVAGTPVRITAVKTFCHAIFIQQLPGQTGRMYVGDRSTMNTTTLVGCNAILPVPTANVLPSANVGISDAPNGLNLADYYVDSTINGEGVLVSILVV